MTITKTANAAGFAFVGSTSQSYADRHASGETFDQLISLRNNMNFINILGKGPADLKHFAESFDRMDSKGF